MTGLGMFGPFGDLASVASPPKWGNIVRTHPVSYHEQFPWGKNDAVGILGILEELDCWPVERVRKRVEIDGVDEVAGGYRLAGRVRGKVSVRRCL